MDRCNNKNESREMDYSISFVRFIAMCFIVACHIMQRDDFSSDIYGAHIEWAFWFNVGVQMFLFISGYLYGKRNKINTVLFYERVFLRILSDYYVFVVAMLVLIHFSVLWNVDKKAIMALLTFSVKGQCPGLNHLWFIPTILFCYLLTPIFHEILNSIDEQSNIRFCIITIMLLIIIHKV